MKFDLKEDWFAGAGTLGTLFYAGTGVEIPLKLLTCDGNGELVIPKTAKVSEHQGPGEAPAAPEEPAPYVDPRRELDIERVGGDLAHAKISAADKFKAELEAEAEAKRAKARDEQLAVEAEARAERQKQVGQRLAAGRAAAKAAREAEKG